jgi:C-terminal processing protease CtpA/Prc
MSGITLKAIGSGLKRFEITNVRKNSPAERAGLVDGDHILTINGITTSELELNSVNAFFNTKPGKRIVLEVDREGRRLKKEFHLENQI